MNLLECICAELVDTAARAPKSEEYKLLLKDFDSTITLFEETLTNKQRNLILELESQRNLLAAMDEDSMFCSGFRTGALLMLELLRPLKSTN